MKKGLLFISIFVLFFLFINATHQEKSDEEYLKIWKKMLKKYPVPDNSIKLQYVASFPSEELIQTHDVYLNGPNHIEIDTEGNIYVSDIKEHRIFKFNANGKFLAQFGKTGQGPGDLFMPRVSKVTKENNLIVLETGNMRFQIFDLTGRFIKSFNIFRGYESFIVDKDGFIFAIPSIQRNIKNLVEVISQDGEILNTFGEPYNIKHNRVVYNRAGISINRREELYVSFHNLSLVRKYSKSGKLLKEYRLDYPILKDNEDYNLKNQSLLAKGKRVKYKPVIQAISPHVDGFYVFHNFPRVEILDYDESGNLKKVFWNIDRFYPYLAIDFLVYKHGKEQLFYVLQIYPIPCIDIYKIKEEQ